jgi:hypothetical protein
MLTRARTDDQVRELATLLARGFLRLADNARTFAVLGANDPHDSLDVSRLESPDHDGNEAA